MKIVIVQVSHNNINQSDSMVAIQEIRLQTWSLLEQM